MQNLLKTGDLRQYNEVFQDCIVDAELDPLQQAYRKTHMQTLFTILKVLFF
ncbi:MAG: hypothetical protein NVS4B12_28670 [Ktedonobacteraceae bacterium]